VSQELPRTWTVERSPLVRAVNAGAGCSANGRWRVSSGEPARRRPPKTASTTSAVHRLASRSAPLASMEAEARLNPWAVATDTTDHLLVNRLRMERTGSATGIAEVERAGRSSSPDCRDGNTLLHSLLALDPAAGFPDLGDHVPLAAAEAATYLTDRRIGSWMARCVGSIAC